MDLPFPTFSFSSKFKRLLTFSSSSIVLSYFPLTSLHVNFCTFVASSLKVFFSLGSRSDKTIFCYANIYKENLFSSKIFFVKKKKEGLMGKSNRGMGIFLEDSNPQSFLSFFSFHLFPITVDQTYIC